MDITNMTKREFYKLPHREWNETIICDSIVILPVKYDLWGITKYQIKNLLSKLFDLTPPEIWEVNHLHDSGYRSMGFVAIRGNEPICLLSGCSDVAYIDGIGGFGYNWFEKGGVPKQIDISGWSIDCLPISGLLHIFPRSYYSCLCGEAFSSFELFSISPIEKTSIQMKQELKEIRQENETLEGTK